MTRDSNEEKKGEFELEFELEVLNIEQMMKKAKKWTAKTLTLDQVKTRERIKSKLKGENRNSWIKIDRRCLICVDKA
jgi:hypothetical protein